LWYQANRPIITAEIRENSSGVGIILFDLVILNSGNRPAVDITLHAKSIDLDNILMGQANENNKKELYSIFSNSSLIAHLNHNQEVNTSFFGWEKNPTNDVCFIEYESKLPIKIKYKDIDGNVYTFKQRLYIKDKNGFGGSMWKST